MHGAQESKLTARAGPRNTRSGLHMANKLLTVLLLQVPTCRARVGWRLREDKAGRSSYSKTRIRPYMHVTSCCAWALGLITIFSAYIVTQCSLS